MIRIDVKCTPPPIVGKTVPRVVDNPPPFPPPPGPFGPAPAGKLIYEHGSPVDNLSEA